QKNVAGISDAQLKKAFDDENRIVPLKDVARINTALSTTVSNVARTEYISKTHQAVLGKLSANAKTKANEVLQQSNKLKSSVANTSREEKNADSTIRICAYHPQANMAKCLIEESKGNIPAAIEAARKATSKSYSSEKENKLKKLGYELKDKDIDWDRPMPQDAMGLGRFKWPDYPMDVEQNKALELEWKMFKLDCEEELAKLKVKQQQ